MRTLREWLKREGCGDWAINSREGLDLEHTWGDLYATDTAPSPWRWGARVLLAMFWTTESKEKSNYEHLAWTAPQVKVDGLTRWAAAELTPWWRVFRKYWRKKLRRSVVRDLENPAAALTQLRKVGKEKSLVYWSEKPALRVTEIISILVACLLPVISVWVLAKVDGLNNLLWCITGFAFLFVLGLIFVTQGTSTRTEIFAATAA